MCAAALSKIDLMQQKCRTCIEKRDIFNFVKVFFPLSQGWSLGIGYFDGPVVEKKRG